MRILVIRHGQAVSGEELGADAYRYLSDEGRVVTRRVAEALAARGLVPTHIYSSALVRAVQTAELVAQSTGYDGLIVTHPPLSPEGQPARALSVLASHGDEDTVALVSHEPTVSAITGHLLGIPYAGFRTSGVAVLDGDARGARLVGRLDPQSLIFG